MARLSSGTRILTPGEAPADLGISERFRAQIRNSEQASQVIQNAINMFQTSDSWLQEVHNILDRMSELAVSAADSSKNQKDRANLDLEFQQLKTEIQRISEDGKFNGLQINGKTAVSFYDTLDHTIKFTQPDGSDLRSLEINLQDGNSATNGIAYAFESAATSQNVGDFLFTEDGKSLVYMAQKSTGTLSARKTLMKLDVESDTVTTLALTSAGGAHASQQARLVMDERGRVWVSDPSTTADSASKNFNVKLLNVDQMTLDAGGAGATNQWAGGVSLASSFSEFAVHGDYIYYIERSGGSGKLQYVKQHLNNQSDKEAMVYDLSASRYDLEAGDTYAISADGQYLAFEDADGTAGEIHVINTHTGETATRSLGSRTNSITAIEFDANNNLYWTDTGGTSDANAVKKARIAFGDKPTIEDVRTVHAGNPGRVGAFNSGLAGSNAMGLSVGGGSPANAYQFQVGADSDMSVSFTSGDVRITKLGISSLELTEISFAKEAIGALAEAVDNVATQRAMIGSQVSRLNFIHSANEGYKNNISATESRIRDVDIANETSNMTKAQILAQTGVSVMAQANAAMQNVLRLLG